MYGAILGDIAGSRFEFDRGPWTKDFDFITDRCSWTDDTVMTVAVAEALMNAGRDADVDLIKKECIASMKKWGKKYPCAGYGGRFFNWVLSDDQKPYNSYGNGSAMRVSAAGWLYDSIDRTREVARATAEVSHNHPEGIKGAECTAAVMFLARTGSSKDAIKEYVINEFGYDISKTVDKMRKIHRHDETCMDALPKALIAFFEGESYEDTVRNAVSLGGDTDTIAAIAGAMAEAFFGMPILLMSSVLVNIEEDMFEVVKAFDKEIGRIDRELESDDKYKENSVIAEAAERYRSAENLEEREVVFAEIIQALVERLSENAAVLMPFMDVNDVLSKAIDWENAKVGDVGTLSEDVSLKVDVMVDNEDHFWVPVFTSGEEIYKGEASNITIPVGLHAALRFGCEGDEVAGVVINPFGAGMTLPKDFLQAFLREIEKENEGNNHENN